jgi:hypothetical protein
MRHQGITPNRARDVVQRAAPGRREAVAYFLAVRAISPGTIHMPAKLPQHPRRHILGRVRIPLPPGRQPKASAQEQAKAALPECDVDPRQHAISACPTMSFSCARDSPVSVESEY